MDLTATRATHELAGLAPRHVLAPRDSAEVAEAIRDADRSGGSVVLWGGGTRIGVGDAPLRYDAALELRGLHGIVDHEPADMVCTVRTGTTLAELAEGLVRAGQRWPVEVGDMATATVGGTIASAAAGPSRLRYQHPRDWIIGCEAVLGDGTIARAGGRVVKNVTGYDLTRLYSGTFGTLAALTEVTLKLVSVPERVRSLVRVDAPAALWSLAADLQASRLPLDAVALDVGATPRLLVRVAGVAAATDRLVRELVARAEFREADPAVWAETAALPVRAERVIRVSVRPGREREAVEESTGPLLAYPGTGIVFLFGALDAETITRLRARIEARGGAVVLERAPAELRRAVGTWGRLGTPPAIARALKERFDPRSVLAPGRLPL